MKYLIFGTIAFILMFAGLYVAALAIMFIAGAILRRR